MPVHVAGHVGGLPKQLGPRLDVAALDGDPSEDRDVGDLDVREPPGGVLAATPGGGRATSQLPTLERAVRETL